MFLLLILLGSILFNLTGLVDTYLTSRFGKEQENGILESSTGTLMIIGGIITLLISLANGLVLGNDIFIVSNSAIFMLLISGFLYGLATLPYFEALKVEKIENIIPIRQTIPIFSYIIANIFLGETFSGLSILLMCIIVLVTGLFGRNIRTGKVNFIGLLLMLLSSLLYSSSFVFFKVGGGETLHIWTAYFWEHIGVSLACFLFLFSNKTRKTTLNYLTNNGVGFSLLNIGNELFYIAGMLITNYLSLYYNIAFINTISNGSQPLLGFLMVFLSYKFLPNIYTWDYSNRELKWKILLRIITFVLLFCFYKITIV